MFESEVSVVLVGSRQSATRSGTRRDNFAISSTQDEEAIKAIPWDGGLVLEIYRERKRDKAAAFETHQEDPSVAMRRRTARSFRETKARANKNPRFGKTRLHSRIHGPM